MSDDRANAEPTTPTSRPAKRRRAGVRMAGIIAVAALVVIAGTGIALFDNSTATAQTAEEVQMAELQGGEITPIPIRPPLNAPMSFADLVERVSPAVVSVTVETEAPEFADLQGDLPFPFPFDQFPGLPRGPQGPQGPGLSQGSGFAISADGHIVTNNHVVDNGISYTVTLADGTELEAELIGTDQATDLAVLRVEPDDPLPFVTFAADEDLRVGDWVVAVGNPFGLGGTVTAGIVSARGRSLVNSNYNDFIQIDAPINRGNSGGPTFDLRGRVIGVNTLIFSPSGGNVGIGFAIPAQTAAAVVDQIIDFGNVRRGWLGVQIQGLDEDLAASVGLDRARGAIVNQVLEGAPAERAGFEQGDVVLELNGEEIEDNRDLTRRVGALRPGEEAAFLILRDGREVTLNATLDLREDLVAAADTDEDSAEKPGMAQASDVLPGLSIVPADTGEGVAIVAVEANSEAAEKGLRVGTIVISVSSEPVSTPDEVADQIDAARGEGRDAVLLLVRENDQERFVALRLETDQG